MSKDHVPSDFARKSGYKSDLEIAETGPMVKSINTNFANGSHNAYVHRTDGTHEHFFQTVEGRSGWHGHNWATRNNHPKQQSNNTESKGDARMKKNSFVEGLKADKATIDRCNEVSREAAKNAQNQSGRNSGPDNGGHERGDSGGPGSLGRESGYKAGETSTSHSNAGEGRGSNGSSGHSSGSHGTGGHGTGGHGSGGHGAGGHGGGGH